MEVEFREYMGAFRQEFREGFGYWLATLNNRGGKRISGGGSAYETLPGLIGGLIKKLRDNSHGECHGLITNTEDHEGMPVELYDDDLKSLPEDESGLMMNLYNLVISHLRMEEALSKIEEIQG